MSVLMRKLLERQGVHRDETKPDGGDGGGGGGDDAAKAAKAAADKAAADKAAADKAAADAAAAAAGDKPTDKEAALLKEVMDKKAKLKEATDAAAAAAAKLKEFDGIDPVAVRKLLADQKAAEDAKLAAAGEWDALKKQMNDAHLVEINVEKALTLAEKARAETAEAKIANLTVGAAFGNSNFIREELALPPSKTRTIFGPHFEFDGERVVGYDKPAGDKSRVQLVDAKGDPLPFEQALKKLVEADSDRDQILKSKMKTGAGSKTDDKGGKPAGSVTELSAKEKIAAGLKTAFKK